MNLAQKTQEKKTRRPRVVSAPLIFSWRPPRRSKIKESPPAILAPIYENFPQELIPRRQWVPWKLEQTKAKKWTKVPYNPNNPTVKASSTNPKTWGICEQARKIAERDKEFAGIGYVFSKGCPYSAPKDCRHSKEGGCPVGGCPYYKFEGDPFTGVDLDHCRNPKTGKIEAWALEEIHRLDSYSEVSPSGTGIHVIVEGELPPEPGRKKGNYEMYSEGRYFTMTGHHLEGTPTTIEPRQAELEALHRQVFGEPQGTDPPKESRPAPQPNPLPTLRTDREIIEKFSTASNGDKFSRLMAGEISAHKSHNEADIALCSMLSFYTQDPAQIDRIIRGSGLMRDKWDRRTAGSTYGARTIDKVLGSLTETYQWDRAGGGNGKRRAALHGQEKDTQAYQETEVNPKQPEFTEAELLNFARDGEVGDARLFIRIFKNKYCYDHAAGQWQRYIDHYWHHDELNHVLKDLDALIDIYSKQASGQGWKKVKATRDGSETAAKQAAAIENIFLKKISLLQKRAYRRDIIEFSAAGDGSLGITGREWDSNPYLIACPNGVVDLNTGGFRDGRPEDYIKTPCPTPWKSLNEPAPEWEKFLKETFDGDKKLIEYNQRLMGYSSSGLREERVTPICFGIGWNGKGTQFEVLGHTLGELAGPVPAELLVKEGKNNTKSAGAPSPEIMMLRGKRLVWASETNQGGRIDSGKLKWLSGGDTMVGRDPYGKRMVHFPPTHTLFLMTNYKPKANSDDFALWGRIHLIPFELSFVDNPAPGTNQRQRDKHLLEKLKKEASGILAWIVRGHFAWKKEGLNPPAKVLSATEEYRQEQDSVRGFIAANCIIGPDAQVKAGDFQKAYKVWCEESGIRPEWGNTVGQRMAERFEKIGVRPVAYKGVGLVGD